MPERRKRLRIGCVGAGYFAAFQHAAWRDLPGAELVAITDRDSEKARAATTGAEQSYGDIAEMLETEDLELIDIATPPETHFELVDAATASGCTVICQKPFCGSLESAREAVALARSRSATVIVHENFRFQPWWRKLKLEIDAGRLGDLYQVTFRLRPGDGQGADAYLDRQPYFQTMPRLLVHETAIHFVDVFRFLLGEPDWVWSDLRRMNPVIKGEDAGLIVMGWEDGRRAVFDGNRLSDHTALNRRLVMGEALAEGSTATIEIDGDGGMLRRKQGSNNYEPIPIEIREDEFGGGCVRALQAHVLASLVGGCSPENLATDYLRNMEIVEAIYESHISGSRISVGTQ